MERSRGEPRAGFPGAYTEVQQKISASIYPAEAACASPRSSLAQSRNTNGEERHQTPRGADWPQHKAFWAVPSACFPAWIIKAPCWFKRRNMPYSELPFPCQQPKSIRKDTSSPVQVALLNTSMLSALVGGEDTGLCAPAEQKSASTSEADSKWEMLESIK